MSANFERVFRVLLLVGGISYNFSSSNLDLGDEKLYEIPPTKNKTRKILSKSTDSAPPKEVSTVGRRSFAADVAKKKWSDASAMWNFYEERTMSTRLIFSIGWDGSMYCQMIRGSLKKLKGKLDPGNKQLLHLNG